MTRPKVDPDKRQRTANACDSCKKRKQKVSHRLQFFYAIIDQVHIINLKILNKNFLR